MPWVLGFRASIRCLVRSQTYLLKLASRIADIGAYRWRCESPGIPTSFPEGSLQRLRKLKSRSQAQEKVPRTHFPGRLKSQIRGHGRFSESARVQVSEEEKRQAQAFALAR